MVQIESLFWGIVAALGALIVELIFFIIFSTSNTSSFSQLFILPQFIILGVCIEEIFKYIIIAKRIEMFSRERSYIINSLFVGLGFFSVELGLILTTEAALQINLLGEIALIHLGTAGLIGYIIATKNPKKISTFIYALTVALLLHSTYNFLTLDRTLVSNYVIFSLLAMIVFINIFNLFRITSKLA